MMEDLFHQLMGHRSPSTSPPPDRRPAVVERADTQPIESSTLPIGSGVVHTNNVSIVETGHSEPSTVAEYKVDNATVADKLDSIDTLIDDYMSGKKKIAKKPAAEKAAAKAAKKAAGIEREDSQDDDSSDDDEEECCDGESDIDRKRLLARIMKAKATANTKKKPSKASAAKDSKAPAGPRATMKRPAAVGKQSASKFPRVDATKSVYWGGGRLYKASGDMVRVYARTSDRKDKRFKFTDPASLNATWEKTCHVIVTDPRPMP